MSRYLVLLVCLFLAGCGTRETHVALVQGDQAVEASREILATPEVRAAVESLDPVVQEVLAPALEKVDVLLGSARVSMAPAIRLTAQGEEIEIRTTTADAVRDPHGFAGMAARQAGRAEVEVEGILALLRLRGLALSYGRALAGDFVAQLTAGGGLGGLLLAGGLKVFAVVRRLRREIELKEREKADAIAYGNAVEAAPDDDAVAKLKAEHIKRQLANGTLGGIAEALAKTKPIPR